MTENWPGHVVIVGVGLLGGSIGLALKQRRPRTLVSGVGRRRQSLDDALAAGAIDQTFLDAAAPAATADLVILATPVGAFEQHLRALAPHLGPGAIVTDVGSTKAQVVRIASTLLKGKAAFVGSHPMAGSDQRGVGAARADLIQGATCIITPTPRTSPPAVERVEAFWRLLGGRTMRMSPAAHDRAVASVSHLPHALSVLLMAAPGEAELAVAATGFADMTRLAGGDVEMWRDIFLTNAPAVLKAMDRFGKLSARLRKLISAGDAAGIERLLGQAQARRKHFISRTGPDDRAQTQE